MANPTTVSPGEVVSSTWGNNVVGVVVPVYATEPDRDTAIPAPNNGRVCFVESIGKLQVFSGSSWRRVVFGEGDTVLLSQGSASAPSLAFNVDPASGVFQSGGTTVSLAAAGGERLRVRADYAIYNPTVSPGPAIINLGSISAAAPAYAYSDDPDSGSFRRAADQISYVAGGIEYLWIGDDAVYIRTFATVGTAANTVLDSSGRIQKSSSARTYKTNEEPIEGTPLVDTDLDPVTFTHEDGHDYIGFTADDLAAQDPRFGTYDDDGVVDNYDLRAVVAVLAAKVNRLEAAAQ